MSFPPPWTVGFARSCLVSTLAVLPISRLFPPSSSGPKGPSILLSLQARSQGLDSVGRGSGESQVPAVLPVLRGRRDGFLRGREHSCPFMRLNKIQQVGFRS